jgi:hypothetical protein
MLARKGYAPVTFEQDDTPCGLIVALFPLYSIPALLALVYKQRKNDPDNQATNVDRPETSVVNSLTTKLTRFGWLH